MRSIVTSACLMIAAAASAQDQPPPVRWPMLVQTANDAAGFAPSGWIVEASRNGDLDGDGIADLVAILHQRSARNVLHGGQAGPAGIDTNPRLLVVAIGQRGGTYRLLLANHSLIPRWTEWNLDDPLGDLDGFRIEHRHFTIPFHLFANAGGWGSFERSFTFRITAGRCVLIGFDEQYLQRNSGESTTTSIDYLTGARAIKTEPADDSPTKIDRKRLGRKPLLAIGEVGDGMDFEPK